MEPDVVAVSSLANCARVAVRLLQRNDVFVQGTFIIGNRRDTHKSIEGLRSFIEDLNPDLAIFMIMTPFPGTPFYDDTSRNGWIEDHNWAAMT